MNIKMTTANKITLVRVALIPIYIVFAYFQTIPCYVAAFVIFTAASITDGIDGHVARKYNQITNLGKIIDPLADKLLTISAFAVFVAQDRMNSIVLILIIARELAITSLRVIAADEGIIIAANFSGKLKTVFQITGILCMLGLPVIFEITNSLWGFRVDMCIYDEIIAWTIAAVTVGSGIDYMIKSKGLLKNK